MITFLADKPNYIIFRVSKQVHDEALHAGWLDRQFQALHSSVLGGNCRHMPNSHPSYSLNFTSINVP